MLRNTKVSRGTRETAKQQGSRLLTNVDLQRLIERFEREAAERLEITKAFSRVSSRESGLRTQAAPVRFV